MSNIVLSIGWPKPKNVNLIKRRVGLNQEAQITWDKIDINTPPFTEDANGNGVDNLKYRITETYIESVIQYDLEGNQTLIEVDKGSNIYHTPNNVFKRFLSEGVNTKVCFEIQAVYNVSDSSLKNTLPIVSGKSEMVCVKLPKDIYCTKNRCKIGTVLSQNQGSSKMRYSNAINNRKSASSFFSNYARGFMNLGTRPANGSNGSNGSRNCPNN
tara:strand:+ start:200 stop:838 length:639 start_codon:yes stop_codon:yes gene_type:complete